MSGVELVGGKETAYKLQQLARHQMIQKLYADILHDMMVCDIEGWDRTEYIRELQECLNHFKVVNDGRDTKAERRGTTAEVE